MLFWGRRHEHALSNGKGLRERFVCIRRRCAHPSRRLRRWLFTPFTVFAPPHPPAEVSTVNRKAALYELATVAAVLRVAPPPPPAPAAGHDSASEAEGTGVKDS
jgi:hypothetical protein